MGIRRYGLALFRILLMLLFGATLAPIAAAQTAPSTAPLTAAPGKSGGEGGGFGRDVTLKAATKQDPFLKTIVGQPSGAPTGNDAQSKCLRIAWGDYTDIKGAPSSIVEVSVITGTDGITKICKVDGYVNPQVGFRILMPLDTWNGKYMQNGCGGACAGPIYIPCEVQVLRGYACLAADMGHRGTTYDTVWAIEDPMAMIDRQWRSTHVATLAGKAITTRYYGQSPKYSYYHGASTGGLQGNTIAQRFPEDFDGIIAGEGGPWRNPNPGGMSGFIDAGRNLSDAQGVPIVSPDEIRMLHKAVIARCDGLDGLKDGIITDPRTCDFKPAMLLCSGAKDANCLSPLQVTAVEHVYNEGRGPQLGSEIAWIGAYVAADGSSGRYARAKPAVQPYSSYTSNEPAPNPDLSALKAHGTKFILYSGWADEVIDPVGPLEYYEKVEKIFGRKETQSFFRFFIIPGQSHIPGGVGAESIEYIKALEDWVERGKAPDMLIGHKLKWISQMMGPMYLDKDLQPSNFLYSRPQYPYPVQARYKGKGDPDDAASFGPWDPNTKKWLK